MINIIGCFKVNNGLILLFIIGFLLVSVAYSHNAPGDFYHDNQVLSQKNDWMSLVGNNKKITEMSIPGTHNSGSRHGLFGSELGKTQSLTIKQQLTAGVRVFDIRLGLYNNKLYLYHGMLYQYQNFADVLADINRFLENYDSEFVLLRIREEKNPVLSWIAFDRAVYNEFDKYSRASLSSDFNQYKLEKARGKIFLLRDFDSSEDKGLSYRGHSVVAQDYYDVPRERDLYEKWEHIKMFFELFPVPYFDDVFHLNYLSGSSFYVMPYFVASGHQYASTQAPRKFTGLRTPEYEDTYPDFPRVRCQAGHCDIDYEGTNTLARAFLDASSDVSFAGIPMVDFPGHDVIQSTINKNFSPND